MTLRGTVGLLLAGALLWAAPARAALSIELVNTPTPIVEDGQTGWEYWYDIVTVGNDMPWSTRLTGFDGTQIINLDSGRLYERWDPSAAGYYLFGQGGDYPSTRAAGGPDEWTLNGSVPWAMINPVHLPSDYSSANYNFLPSGTVDANGLYFTQYTAVGFRTGIFGTFRIVHPLGPGLIDYAFESMASWATGQVIGPAVATVIGDFDGNGDVDADDIDLLCANLGDVAFDLDGDGDADEDDMIYLIETLVELQDGSGRVGTKRGDFNLDGFVDGTDLALMKVAFGQPGQEYADGNANCDALVDGTDLAILKVNMGFIAPTGGGVPEPATLSLLALGGLALLRRRRA